jgi:hypothetical protein
MIKSVDKFDSLTGWVYSTGSPHPSAYLLNDIEEYIAGRNLHSVIFEFPAGCTGKYIGKPSLSIDVTGYTELVFNTWSRERSGSSFLKVSDYQYKIKLATGSEYYFETRSDLSEVVIDITGLNTITEITITALHDELDYIVVSDMIAVKDEMPLDIFTAFKTHLDADIAVTYPYGLLIGTLNNIYAGDKYIDFLGLQNFLARYSVIQIRDGTHSEIHHILSDEDGKYYFTSLYDGDTILYDYATANIYLTFPVEFGKTENDIILPSITIWGMTPEFIMRGAKLDTILDSFKVGGFPKSRREGQILKYNLLVDCEARQNEMVALLSMFVKNFIGKEYLWINGRMADVKFEGIPTELQPEQAYEIIPKIQYNISIEVKEELWERTSTALVTSSTVTVTPQ